MDIRYRVQGGIPLQGEVTIGGSKNAALPLIAASLLVAGEVVLENLPRIRDTEVMLQLLEHLGAKTSAQGNTVSIDASAARSRPLPKELVSKLRASILFLGPLLARFGVAEMAYPGGDVIGKRPVHAHILAFEQLGIRNMSSDTTLSLQGTLRPGEVILPEFSVTATENILMAAALQPKHTRIELAATEPHVQDLCTFLGKIGASIEDIGSHALRIRGTGATKGTRHRVPFDYIEAGSLVVAALVTKGKVRIREVERPPLLMFLEVLKRGGAVCKLDEQERTLFVDGELSLLQAMHIQTNIYPGFPSDLQAPIGVAMTQAKGVSRIFEVLYEGRLGYLYELEKMGAHVEMLNAHQALIIGPTPLRGRIVASNDIRAGASMVLAALCAEGESVVTDVHYIERGHERLDQKLLALGARIERTVSGELNIA
jgi:UDP-N-acetylglucosamine 1-carboxyvinyltransferase